MADIFEEKVTSGEQPGVEAMPTRDVVEYVVETPEDEQGDELTDLFEVTEEDKLGHANEDLADLTEVTQEDVMGRRLQKSQGQTRIVRRVRRVQPPVVRGMEG